MMIIPSTFSLTILRHLLTTLSMIVFCSVLVGCAVGSGGASAEPPIAEASPITIRWSTASELDNYGFHVYRGLDADGPFERLTQQVIPGAGTTDLPQSYEFEDLTASSGTTFYYWVESVSLSGKRRRLTPIQAVEAPP